MKFDKQLLKEVLSIQSYHKDDDDKMMMDFIRGKIRKYGGTFTEDTFGNIYVTKGSGQVFPCIVAHTDTVHPLRRDFKIFEYNDLLFAFSATHGGQTGIGGDDKCGVFIALNALKDSEAIKLAFFRKEEVGCKGSAHADMTFFANCGFVLQADRKGNTDFITTAGGTQLNNTTFTDEIKDILDAHGYKLTTGLQTDVMKLKDKGLTVCAANISCGYWGPHTDGEIVRVSDVEDCYNMMMEIIELCGDTRWPHIYVAPSFVPSYQYKHRYGRYNRNYGHYYNDYDNEDDSHGQTKLNLVGVNNNDSKSLSNSELEEWKKDSNGRDVSAEIMKLNKEEQSITHLESPPELDWNKEDEDDEVEEFLEEIDARIADLESVIEEYKAFRLEKMEKVGKI